MGRAKNVPPPYYCQSHPYSLHKPRLTGVQPTLMTPLCVIHQLIVLKLCCIWATYVLSVLAADSLLGAISTGACAYDSDRSAVDGQERANKRYIVGNTQEAGEYIEVGLGGLPMERAPVKDRFMKGRSGINLHRRLRCNIAECHHCRCLWQQ